MKKLTLPAACILCLTPAAGVVRGAEGRISVEGVARGLPLVDTIDADGKPRFSIRGYGDFRYTRPRANAGSLENTGGPAKADARFTTKDAADYTFYDLDGLVLAKCVNEDHLITPGQPRETLTDLSLLVLYDHHSGDS